MNQSQVKHCVVVMCFFMFVPMDGVSRNLTICSLLFRDRKSVV